HKGLLHQAASDFGLVADADLDVMRPDQALAALTSRLLDGIDSVMAGRAFDVVLAQGDTTTVLASAMASFYRRIPFAHVEAGLRTESIDSPFPEEANRRLAGALASIHYAPTRGALANLLREGVPADRIVVTGNTGIDALLDASRRSPELPVPVSSVDRLVLVTLHRRESLGAPLRGVLGAIREAIVGVPRARVVWPVHPNPHVREAAAEVLSGVAGVELVEPQGYLPFVALMQRADVIVTDSGGVQEEAPTFGAPILVVRETTERPEGVDAGLAELVGTDPVRIARRLGTLLATSVRRTQTVNPYGDGRASIRIADSLIQLLGTRPALHVTVPNGNTTPVLKVA
ncbi:MAG: UDP-N-acetylglucosamine 2-epimerase (non-hydrolyzing), partial [Deltaproteobacteria bacterium]